MKDLLKKNWLLLAVVVYAIVMTFTSVDNKDLAEHYRIEKEQAQRHIKKQIDSVNRVIKRKDEQLLKAMRESAEADMLASEAVAEAQKYKKKYEGIRFIHTRTDRERDSLIRAVLHP